MDTKPLAAPTPSALATARALYDELCLWFGAPERDESGHTKLRGKSYAINIALVLLGLRPGYSHHRWRDATEGLSSLTAILTRYGLRAVLSAVCIRTPGKPELFIIQAARQDELADDLRIVEAACQAEMNGETAPKDPEWGRLLGYRTPHDVGGSYWRDTITGGRHQSMGVAYRIRAASTPPVYESRRDYANLWGYGCDDANVDPEVLKRMGGQDHAVIRAAVAAMADDVVVEFVWSHTITTWCS